MDLDKLSFCESDDGDDKDGVHLVSTAEITVASADAPGSDEVQTETESQASSTNPEQEGQIIDPKATPSTSESAPETEASQSEFGPATTVAKESGDSGQTKTAGDSETQQDPASTDSDALRFEGVPVFRFFFRVPMPTLLTFPQSAPISLWRRPSLSPRSPFQPEPVRSPLVVQPS